jgi:hypothetical protein
VGVQPTGMSVASRRIQSVTGTVRNHDGRRTQGRSRQKRLAPRTRGHLLEALVHVGFQSETVSRIEHSIVDGRVLLAGNSLEHPTPGLCGKRQAIVGHIGQAAFGLQRRVGQRMSVDPHVSGIRCDSARDDAQKTGFAAAVFFA